MNIEIDIRRIKEKAMLIVNKEDEFSTLFDSELYADLIENIEDYIAEGVAAHFIKQYE